MGQDYIARKQAKKFRKVQRRGERGAKQPDVVDFETGEDGKVKKRERKKKNQPRRLCRGMCYGTPQFEEEDKVWKPEDAVGIIGADSNFDFPKANIAVKDLFVEPKEKKTEGGAPGDGRKEARAGKKRKRKNAPGDDKGSDGEESEEDLRLDRKRERKEKQSKIKEEAADAAKAAPISAALRKQHPIVQQYFAEQGLRAPTPLQEACWNVMAAHPDKALLVVAPPGAGATLAYVLGTALRLAGKNAAARDAPCALILAPSSAAAQLVLTQLRPLLRSAGLRCAAFHSGVDLSDHLEKLGAAPQPHVVVGTADRLAELLRGGSLKPGALEYLIFDGVERLATSAKAQTALEKFQALAAASAPGGHSVTTIAVLSPEAEGGAKGVVNAEAAARGLVGKGALKLSVDLTSELVPTSLHLSAILCAEPKKPKRLEQALTDLAERHKGRRTPLKVLVASASHGGVDIAFEVAVAVGLKAERLGPATPADDLEAAVNAFKSGKLQLLSVPAELLQSNQLHCRNVDLLAFYDCPATEAAFLRACAVTGPLAAAPGATALVLVTKSDARMATVLTSFLRGRKQAVDAGLEKLAETFAKIERELGAEAAATFLAQSLAQDRAERAQVEDAHGGAAAAPVEAAAGAANGSMATISGRNQGKGVAAVGLIGSEAIRELKGGGAAARRAAMAAADIKLVPTAGDRERRDEERLKRRAAREAEAAEKQAAEDDEEENGDDDHRPSTSRPSQLLAKTFAQVDKAREAAAGPPGKKARTDAGEDGDLEVFAATPDFVAAKTFRGAREGYAFKKGAKGLGYYKDVPPVVRFHGGEGKPRGDGGAGRGRGARREAGPGGRGRGGGRGGRGGRR